MVLPMSHSWSICFFVVVVCRVPESSRDQEEMGLNPNFSPKGDSGKVTSLPSLGLSFPTDIREG